MTNQEILREMLRKEHNNYLSHSRVFIEIVSGVKVAWISMQGLGFEAYVYSAEDGEKLCGELMELGFHSAALNSFEHQRDGLTHIVRFSL